MSPNFSLLSVVCAMLLIGGACSSAKAPGSPTLPVAATLPASGSNMLAVYNNSCAGCHGNRLQHFKMLKSYDKELAKLSDVILKGNATKGMPAFGNALSAAQADSLSAFIKNYNYTENHVAPAPVGQDYTYEVVVDGLEIPWGMEFLPNGDLLVAEKKGVLSRLSNGKLYPISGLPPIRTEGQGGLLDLKLHPDYANNGWLYVAYSYPDEARPGHGNTAILRARLGTDNALHDVQHLYKGTPSVSTNYHFGTRMVLDGKGYLYFGIGDRGKHFEYPQVLDNSNGKIHRIHDDGRIPADNPFANRAGAMGSVYSYGHRNPQGLAMHPGTGQLWEHEHGPRGGDEINLIQPGKNYGWPVICYGINYDGSILTDLTEQAGMEQPLHYYVPSIAPCGMAFLAQDNPVYPKWQGSLLIGSLRFQYLERLTLYETQVVGQEKLLEELESRVRDVRVSPDGYIYVAVEGPGRILKVLPK